MVHIGLNVHVDVCWVSMHLSVHLCLSDVNIYVVYNLFILLNNVNNEIRQEATLLMAQQKGYVSAVV